MTVSAFNPLAGDLHAESLWAAFGSSARLRPDAIAAAFVRALQDRPEETRSALQALYDRQWTLWQSVSRSPPPAADARDPGAHPWFRYLRDQHRLWEAWGQDFAMLLDLPPMEQRRTRVALRQALDAIDPDNALATNPRALLRAIETHGESIARGLNHLSRDIAKRSITTSAGDGFTIGVDLAATPGSVVHASPVAQLIHYRAAGPQVRSVPLLVVPPFINKYYILDLRPASSFVRYATAQGFDVFLLSWVDPDPSSAFTWEHYIERGVLEALDEVTRVTRMPQANVLGYCVGGTLATTALAVDQARGHHRAASLTLLATLLDFADAGDMSVYLDADSVGAFESEFATGGVMDGSRLAAAFSSLRARELVWHFVQHNYLLGEETPGHDFLHWNSDGTGVPGPLFAFYIRQMYLENRLILPGAIRLCGHPIDLALLQMPIYALATRADHIVPWTSAFDSARRLGGPARFVLAQSGHVAGIVNPPEPVRRGYWTNSLPGSTAQEWLAMAQPHAGSWWHDWSHWLGIHSGAWRRARRTRLRESELEAAPGSYVMGRGASGPQTSQA
ncbi:MAG: alpha/beta fold hydrolase [Burkholderiales bacterium]